MRGIHAGPPTANLSPTLMRSVDRTGNTHLGDIAVDASGNAYVTGNTDSTDFPIANALQPTYGGGQFDAFVAQLNPAGSAFVYSTYLGGSDSDQAFGIAVDGSGNAYVTGTTGSSNFPTKNALQPKKAGRSYDAFVTKISSADALVATSSVPALSEGTTATPLTLPQVQPVLDEAIGRWQTAGVDTSVLQGIDVRIANLGVRRSDTPHGHAALVDQLFGQSGDHQTDSWLGAFLDERLNMRRPWFKRRR